MPVAKVLNRFAVFIITAMLLFTACQKSDNPADTSSGDNSGGNNGGTTNPTKVNDIKGNGNYALYLSNISTVYTVFVQNSAYGTSLAHYKVAGLSNIRKIAAGPANTAAGNYEAIALDNTGKIFTINMNFSTGKPDSALQFTQMSSFAGSIITDIAAGGDGTTQFFLALDQSGRVWSWGNGGASLYGIYTGGTPQIIQGLSSIASISAGTSQGLALNSSGNVYNWGVISWQNDEKYASPTLVIGASPATSIDAGDNYNIAKRQDGSVYAWGHLMDGVVPGIATPYAFSAGAELYFSPMFIKTDGTIYKTSFSMMDGSPQVAEAVQELSSYRFSIVDASRIAYYLTTGGQILVQSSTGTAPYVLSTLF